MSEIRSHRPAGPTTGLDYFESLGRMRLCGADQVALPFNLFPRKKGQHHSSTGRDSPRPGPVRMHVSASVLARTTGSRWTRLGYGL
ncbi:Hypothetical protein MexAM1_p3METAp0027 (plasmid) [Methylorubrum extorquens AM1]|uniref:Uncharacterized protein n=1 Tax=Methylorubrum extorquens (strain ATCC 14718 / DSM 1338 / JCM 2805 / NCIMB 9133 / AM1) TaxID=272630 RepID=C5B6W9_METEA|nr:Hypothetical protein MexAM1_p3METAp0027 [Methylorubrum extorquens AM1]